MQSHLKKEKTSNRQPNLPLKQLEKKEQQQQQQQKKKHPKLVKRKKA